MNCLVVVDSRRVARRFRRLAGLPAVAAPGGDGAEVVVNWAGNTRPERLPPAACVLNRPQAVQLTQDASTRSLLLGLAGLAVARPTQGVWYRAHVFDCRVIALFRCRRDGRRVGFQRVSTSHSKLLQNAGLAAVRAVAALRLDFGVVDLVLRDDGPAVIAIHPNPPSGTENVRRYARQIRRFARVWSAPVEDFLIGADPEFVVLKRRTSRLVVASRYLRRHGALGVDSQRLYGSRNSRPIAELRPKPASDPEEVVQRIRQLLSRMPAKLRSKDVSWCAGSCPREGYPIGGHVHLSRLPLTAAFVRALDTYVALPMLLIEYPRRAVRRRRRYGFLSEVREKSWGFEYRTLPSWLVGAGYARAVLSLTKLVGRHWRRLQRDPFLDPQVVRAFYACDKEVLRPLFEGLWADIASLPEYPQYAPALEGLADAIRRGRTWNERADFRRAWGLR